MTAGDEALVGWTLEQSLWGSGYALVAGVDEAGRGALAGPVTAAAVLLPYCPSYPFNDSKRLSPMAREKLAARIKLEAWGWALGWADATEVDALNVLRATHAAAQRALARLSSRLTPAALVTDYLRLACDGPVVAVPKADARSYQVAAASILAKTARDEYMRALALAYPHYGFERHKGYGTPAHLQALERYGPSPQHRRSFRPVLSRLFSGSS